MFFGPRYIGAESSLIQSNSRDLVISPPPPYCTRVSKDTGSSSCIRKILRPSVYFSFLDISTISASFAGILDFGIVCCFVVVLHVNISIS